MLSKILVSPGGWSAQTDASHSDFLQVAKDELAHSALPPPSLNGTAVSDPLWAAGELIQTRSQELVKELSLLKRKLGEGHSGG